ncbi:MAG: arginine--tRNA ligase [Oscillospiraceae bacterium]|jgi:arginyl-tRNA synthetase|nr:arginine--tRNA ligase [Oscillospiraceae bacterium]
MSDVFLKTKSLINEKIKNSLKLVKKELGLQTDVCDEKIHKLDFSIEIPFNRSHGDFATNAAFILAKILKISPLKIAKSICKNFDLHENYFKTCEVAGNGFINFILSEKFYNDVLKNIKNKNKNYGKSDFYKGKKVIVEFVSANPTGDMHLGNARGGSLGDCLASVLEATGYKVHREFYVNDAGNQIEKLAQSLEARYLQFFLGEDSVAFPEDGYKNYDIISMTKEFIRIYKNEYVGLSSDQRKKALLDFALPKNVEKMKKDLQKYKIKYDKWFYESDLYKNKEIENIIEELKLKNSTYEEDGVLWAKSSIFNCEKDKVLVRKNGVPTYFTADIAYHYNKFIKRNFDLCVNIWGADHHGHVARMKGAMKALGIDEKKLKIVIVQIVRLVRGNEVVRMSKRTGKTIGLVDLLEEVEINEARFMFNMLKANTQMDFDLDLATRKSAENPVYYVQYAHARICSILKKNKKKVDKIKKNEHKNLELLNSDFEKNLIFCLAYCTEKIINAAKKFEPANITRYVLDVATLFHKFYNHCRIEVEDLKLMNERLYLCLCTKIVIKNILNMFKIDAPEVM